MGYEPANDPVKLPGDSGPIDRYGLYGPNAWPEEETLPGFRHTVEGYYRELMGFARRFLPIFAQALGVEENVFDELLEYPGTLFRLLHYLPFDPTDPDASSIGSHTVSKDPLRAGQFA
jgi:isopenicillin N synthase-like dioxygenase